MNRVSELSDILKKTLNWNKARLTCFTQMLMALFAVRTVNLRALAVACVGSAEIDSKYKRLKRFFSDFQMDHSVISRWLFSLFFSNTDKFYVTIDRTNWYWGKAKINIFTLGIAYEGMAIPIAWKCLNKAGNASAEEHQALIQQFIDLFGQKQIAGVLGDREFGSGDFFGWLNAQGIPFYIRIKEDSIVRIKNKKLFKAATLFKSVCPKQHQAFSLAVEIFGQSVFLAGSRSDKGELMVVATNQPPKNAIAIYLRRWEIETLFSCLKGRGFQFEATRLTRLERIEKLMVLLAVGAAWAHKTGEWPREKTHSV